MATKKINGVYHVSNTQTGGSGDDPNAVKYVEQTLTDAQKAQARTNINAPSVADLNAIGNGSYVEAWDGASTPVVADIPAGVVVTYNTTDYTGTLAASASTVGKIYLVSTGTSGNYDRYITETDGTNYSWHQIGTTAIDLSDYATKEEVSQLSQEVDGKFITQVGNPGTGSSYWYRNSSGIIAYGSSGMGAHRADFIGVNEGETISLSTTLGSIQVDAALFSDDSGNVVSIITRSGGTTEFNGTVPTGATRIYINYLSAYEFKTQGLMARVDKNEQDIESLDGIVDGIAGEFSEFASKTSAKFDQDTHTFNLQTSSGWVYSDWFKLFGGVTYDMSFAFGTPSTSNALSVYCRDRNESNLFNPFTVASTKNSHEYSFTPSSDIDVRFEIYGNNSRTVDISVVGGLISTDLLERVVTLENSLSEFPLIKTNTINSVNPFRDCPLYDHIFMETIDGVNVIIPWESLPNVEISHRLGFGAIEANIHKTSDNNYIVMHGDNGTFGRAVEHIDGVTDIQNVAINSVTLQWVLDNVRFKSIYPKYRTAPATLEAFLLECSKFKMTPVVTAGTDDLCRKIDGIVGRGNYVALNGNRSYHNGPITQFVNGSTKEEILQICRNRGVPFIYSMSNPDDFTDQQLLEIVAAVHGEGYQISFAGCYLSEAKSQRLFGLGFDASASGWTIPKIRSGNLLNLSGDLDFSAFSTDGTVLDNSLQLSNGQTVELPTSPAVEFLAGAQLELRFSGTIHLNMGKFINDDLTSDGKKTHIVSTYYLMRSPSFQIESVGDSVIESIIYRSSRF